MKILLDECVPIQVRNALVGHDVSTAQEMGWGGISNGECRGAIKTGQCCANKTGIMVWGDCHRDEAL